MTSGIAAFAYLALLWYAAPVLSREAASIADRLRAVLLLGVAIPGALALVHLLYAPLLWIGAIAAAAWRIRKKPPAAEHDGALYAAFGAALLVLWPPLARPLLDGDSLLYHLPNAAAFAQTHSLWTARAPYWLYPPGSELFASGLLVASGRWSLPLAGALPALLLLSRLYGAARSRGAPAYAAAGAALAFVCTPVAAFQAGTLQNDLWLAAFLVEIVASADGSAASLAVCALLKPYGWIEALIGAAAARISLRTVALSFLPLIAWIVRDAILLAQSGSPGFSAPGYWGSTIAGNGAAAFAQLAHGIAAATPQAFLWIGLLVLGLAYPAARRFALAGIAAFALYAFLPVSYSNGITNYVLDASSLRYALPALACGGLVGAVLCVRAPLAAAAGYAVAAWGAWSVLGVFWNDSYTHWALAAAALAVAAGLVARRTRGILAAAAALGVLLLGAQSAAARASGFYGDWMRQPSGKPTGAFSWIAARRPPRVLAVNVREGAIIMSSPSTAVTLAFSASACEQARRERALIFAGSNEDADAGSLPAIFAKARSCGKVVYEDGAAIIVQAP